jgi:hypothetical protein
MAALAAMHGTCLRAAIRASGRQAEPKFG